MACKAERLSGQKGHVLVRLLTYSRCADQHSRPLILWCAIDCILQAAIHVGNEVIALAGACQLLPLLSIGRQA